MSGTAQLKIGIFGANGYTGGELLRWLAAHPFATVTLATSREFAGQAVAVAHPFLAGVSSLSFASGAEADWLKAAESLDLVFLALPHGRSMDIVPKLPEQVRVIDLGGDYRLSNDATYEKHYGQRHTDGKSLASFTYGMSELFRAQLSASKRVANPGCFATAVSLALAPLAKAALAVGDVHVAAVTGSTGSGAKTSGRTHHPVRAEAFSAYKPFKHQHVPEIEEHLGKFSGTDWTGRLVLQTHSAPIVRGIYATCFVRVPSGTDATQVAAAFESAYAGSPFVRLRGEPPDLKWVRHSNFADIGWALDGERLVVMACIDNLVKGAAGQAIQNMNLMHGWPEATGLLFPAGGV